MKPYIVLSLLVSRKSKSCSCSHQVIVSNLRVRTSGATLQKHFLTKKKLQVYKESNSLCEKFFEIWRSNKWPQLCEVLNEVLLSSTSLLLDVFPKGK